MKKMSKYDTYQYWDDLLKKYNLSMEKGRNEKLWYVGGPSILERIEGEQLNKGHTKPKKQDE